ncbi:branched-chain amino acid ABC transporter permease [Achromobacter seleniivolatilans]|uniref:Branched-chain amino acid ABC transporter permease n=1 Tax=Achromobacter seleniivolatilans TaxID=3047478 RepID=A0ABY9M5P5_9BURK|nr:branched-chain amino acid ABC transporter permease [Achromobacter sp. R39]WMD22135.1 branched-chain amino acid ABC transporter permease [Achromobacter sp. R39]
MTAYLIFVAAIAGIYALMAMGLATIWGQGGMVNLGLVGFFALGAYTSALTSAHGLPVVVAWLAGALLAGAVGVLLTLSTRRMRGDYLAIVSLGFAEVIRLVANNETWLTKGSDGISGIASPFAGALAEYANLLNMLMIWSVVSVVAWILTRLLRSPYGRALRAVRDDDIVAAVAGKRVLSYKKKTFFLGAAVTGLAGAIYAHLTSYIAPDGFVPLLTIYIFLAVTLGGYTRLKGAVIGAVAVVALLEGTRFVAELLPGVNAVQASAVREFVIAVALIAMMQCRSEGLLKERHDMANQKGEERDGGSANGAPHVASQ